MSEQVTTKYQPLFEIRLLHHYWLDEGATLFDALGQAKKESHLRTYDMRGIFSIVLTRSTATLLNGIGGLYRETSLGCVVLVPEQVRFPSDGTLRFAVVVKDPELLNYTALTLRSQKIYQLYDQSQDLTYRYKENVPVLSNATGVSRAAGPAQGLYLSREIPAIAPNDQVEAICVSGVSLVQLTADQPGAAMQQIGATVSDCAVFVHQGDVPPITPPAGLSGVPARGILLTDDIPDAVFVLIHIVLVRPGAAEFSVVDGNGQAKVPHPVFQVRFKNRSTFWRYINRTTLAETSTESVPLPLTRFGNAGTKHKPSGGFVKPVKSGERITQLISEIHL